MYRMTKKLNAPPFNIYPGKYSRNTVWSDKLHHHKRFDMIILEGKTIEFNRYLNSCIKHSRYIYIYI